MNEGMAECESKMSPLRQALEGLKHALGDVEEGVSILVNRLDPVRVLDKDCALRPYEAPPAPCSEVTAIVLVQTDRLMHLREDITCLLASLEV